MDKTIQTMDGWMSFATKAVTMVARGNNRITPGNLQKKAGGQKLHCTVFF